MMGTSCVLFGVKQIYENVNLNSEFFGVYIYIYKNKVLGENKASVMSMELQLSLPVQEP